MKQISMAAPARLAGVAPTRPASVTRGAPRLEATRRRAGCRGGAPIIWGYMASAMALRPALPLGEVVRSRSVILDGARFPLTDWPSTAHGAPGAVAPCDTRWMTSAPVTHLVVEATNGASSDTSNRVMVSGLPDVNSRGEPLTAFAREVRRDVLEHLHRQGFQFLDGGLAAPHVDDKSALRSLHREAVRAKVAHALPSLARYENRFVARLADGASVVPERIRPRLVEVTSPRSEDGLLWRWATLHWSIPVSSGYGRRLRFLVVDDGHDGRLMGLVGLTDPVFAMRARDGAIGWDAQQRRDGLIHLMDAFVLGAVPPYRGILAGKLMALLATSNDVRSVFEQKYRTATSRISGVSRHAQLAAVTTSSALGRSSVYNRLRRQDGSLSMRPVGYSSGTGDFHFTGGIYERLVEVAAAALDGKATQRHQQWGGTSFRNRREVVQRALLELGLDGRRLRAHGVQRQLFLGATAENSEEFLRGEAGTLGGRAGNTVDELAEWWKHRWAVPRAGRETSWRDFRAESWQLYGAE